MHIAPAGNFARLVEALAEIGKPVHPSWGAERIAMHVRYVVGDVPRGLTAEAFASIALSRIAQ